MTTCTHCHRPQPWTIGIRCVCPDCIAAGKDPMPWRHIRDTQPELPTQPAPAQAP